MGEAIGHSPIVGQQQQVCLGIEPPPGKRARGMFLAADQSPHPSEIRRAQDYRAVVDGIVNPAGAPAARAGDLAR